MRQELFTLNSGILVAAMNIGVGIIACWETLLLQ